MLASLRNGRHILAQEIDEIRRRIAELLALKSENVRHDLCNEDPAALRREIEELRARMRAFAEARGRDADDIRRLQAEIAAEAEAVALLPEKLQRLCADGSNGARL